ncbi:MAG: hypothetical protein V4689_05890 [Verrucomicrobiota bacterium]
MAQFSPDDFSVSNSIATFVVHIRSILEQEEVSFRLLDSGMTCRVDSLEAKERGISLQLRGYGPIYIDVVQIEPDSFFRAHNDNEGIIPQWMTA